MAVPPIHYRATDYPPQYRPVGYWRHARRQPRPRGDAGARRGAGGCGRCSASCSATLVLHAGIAAAYLAATPGLDAVGAGPGAPRRARACDKPGEPEPSITVPPTDSQETPDPASGRPDAEGAPPTRPPPEAATAEERCSDRHRPGAGEVSTLLERTLFEAKRVLVGQDRMLERLLVCLLAARPLPARRCARSRQDARGRDARASSAARSPASSSRPTSCPPTSSARRSTGRHARRSTSSSARCSPTSCSPTRSTARRPRCSRRCSRSWPSSR